MDPALAALVAKQEITEVLLSVARATDRSDIELYTSCFHEDGEDYHGLTNGPVSQIIAVLARSKLLVSQHAITNTMIQLDGDVAKVESCFNAFHQSRDESGQLWDEHLRGRYLDRVERRGGPWKIARRIVVWDWSRLEPSGETWFDRVKLRPEADDRFIFSRRDEQDILYTDALPDGF